MATPVIMPRQGQSVETCIISKWFKAKNDPVEKGDILFSYETDKAAFEAEAETGGILLDRFYEEGDEVPVLEVVAVIGREGESTGKFRSGVPVQEETISEVATEKKGEELPAGDVPAAEQLVQAEPGAGIKISPRARKAAQKLGITVEGISGSGPYGRITEKDVLNASKSAPRITPLAREIARDKKLKIPATGTGIGGRVTASDVLSAEEIYENDFELKSLSNVRKIIAEKMHQSLQQSAQLTHHTSADARRMLEYRKLIKEAMEKGGSENITINDMVCFATIKALKKHPAVNSQFFGDSAKVFRKVHLAFAVDTERGLMVPVVRNADDLSLSGLASRMKTLADSCKKGSVNPELIAGEAGSFTVSNLGVYGIEMFTPIINIPQVAILGVNTIVSRPADMGSGVFGFIPYIGLSLTYDHRAVDGAPASAFLRDVRNEIENLEIFI